VVEGIPAATPFVLVA